MAKFHHFSLFGYVSLTKTTKRLSQTPRWEFRGHSYYWSSLFSVVKVPSELPNSIIYNFSFSCGGVNDKWLNCFEMLFSQ